MSGETVVFEVAEGRKITLGSPSVLALANGRLLAAFDQTGPDVKGLPGLRGHDARTNHWMQGRVMSSTDGGATWKSTATYPFRHATLFRDGGDVYLLGEADGGLRLMRSPDGGTSWSSPTEVTGDRGIWVEPGCVAAEGSWWYAAGMSGRKLVVARAPKGASLMNRKAWTLGAAEFEPAAAFGRGGGWGIPGVKGGAVEWSHPRWVKVEAEGHPAKGRLLLWGTTVCGREHRGAFVAVDGETLKAGLLETDAGPWCWGTWPGAHGRFDTLRDASTQQQWTAGDAGSGEGRVAWGAERVRAAAGRRIGLWSSGNLCEWRPAGMVFAGGAGPAGMRCDPAVAVAGGALAVLCRAGGERSRTERETTRILCRRVEDFRRAGRGKGEEGGGAAAE